MSIHPYLAVGMPAYLLAKMAPNGVRTETQVIMSISAEVIMMEVSRALREVTAQGLTTKDRMQFMLSDNWLTAKTRLRAIVEARQIFHALCLTLCSDRRLASFITIEAISEMTGHDHASVINGMHRVNEQLQVPNAQFHAKWNNACRALGLEPVRVAQWLDQRAQTGQQAGFKIVNQKPV
jgi:hypothetical protein